MPIATDTLLAQLQWRYATKSFDPARKIPPADWAALEQALILSPSSYGMQPYRFIVITNPEVKEQLVPFSWNQKQPAECSHYVVFAARTENTEADVDRYLARIAEVRESAVDSLGGFRKMLLSDLVAGPRGKIAHEWATRQAYIALGNFMTAAALVGIDTCPMEGFVPEQYDAALGLPEQGFKSVVACAAGYRLESDKYATLPKVRMPASQLVTHL
ncbi:MAG TPA: NAD(P)H-dependent oxidoreductase [Chthoniobacteraceae bacterium]|jgi:nitroreductase